MSLIAQFLIQLCVMYIAADFVEVKIEADDNSISGCPHDDMPSTGMFLLFPLIHSLHLLTVTFEE